MAVTNDFDSQEDESIARVVRAKFPSVFGPRPGVAGGGPPRAPTTAVSAAVAVRAKVDQARGVAPPARVVPGAPPVPTPAAPAELPRPAFVPFMPPRPGETAERARAIGRVAINRARAAGLGLATSFIPGPLGEIGAAAGIGFALAGPPGALAFGAAATARATVGRILLNEVRARDALNRARGVRAFGPGAEGLLSAFQSSGGVIKGISAGALEAKERLSGVLGGVSRRFEVAPLRTIVDTVFGTPIRIGARVFTKILVPPTEQSDALNASVQRGITAVFDWAIPGADSVRLNREDDIAQWQSRPANAHPQAIKALDIMRARLDLQLTSSGEYGGWKKAPSPGG